MLVVLHECPYTEGTSPVYITECTFQICHYLNWVVRHITDVEMQMNAVERVEHYSHVETAPSVSLKQKGSASLTSHNFE